MPEEVPMGVPEGRAQQVSGQSKEQNKGQWLKHREAGIRYREGSGAMERGNDQIHILKGFLGLQYEEQMAEGCGQ